MNTEKRKLIFEIKRCKELRDTQVLEKNDILTLSALTEVLIRLNYILNYLNTNNKRVIWKDDVEIGDVTDLINNVRNAACHSESSLNRIQGITLTYNRFVGCVPNAFNINGVIIGSKYEDDIAFNWGQYIIYLKRHIYRLIDEIPILLSRLND